MVDLVRSFLADIFLARPFEAAALLDSGEGSSRVATAPVIFRAPDCARLVSLADSDSLPELRFFRIIPDDGR